MSDHAKLSPSGAERWMNCPGSLRMEDGMPDTSSLFADEGTAAHFLASTCLEQKMDAKAFTGRDILVYQKSGDTKAGTNWAENCSFGLNKDGRKFTVYDMAGFVQVYLDNIRQFASGNDLMIEQRVNFSERVGVPDQFGTADAIILTADGEELQIHDLKYGRGVRVDAEENKQMMLYALGAYDQFAALGDIKRIRMVIHQPRLEHLSEWDCSVDDLLAFAAVAKKRAFHAIQVMTEKEGAVIHHLVAGDKQCKFCKAKAICPKLAQTVAETTGADFEDLTQDALPSPGVVTTLDDQMAKVDLVETWCKAVRAETERRLLEGVPVAGYKLVQGKQGNRAWMDKAQAEAVLKSMRIKHEEMYDYEIVSPTTAEKLFKAKIIGPRQWPTLQQLITRSAGKPSVAPESDKRGALVLRSADDFETVEEGADLV